MTDKKILLTAIGVATLFLMAYVICFWGKGISDNTTDWGAFGNYVAVCLSVLSISLIYITYSEQRKSNEISRAEHHIATMLNSLETLSEKNQLRIKSVYSNISEHFKAPTYDLCECEYDIIVRVCTFYYSSALVEREYSQRINYYYQYLYLCIDNINHNKTLSKEQKKLQITELSCILTEDSRLLFFFWLLIHARTELNSYYKYGLFIMDEESSPLLQDIVNYICTEKCPLKRQSQIIDDGEILYEYSPKEQFSDTYSNFIKKS